MKHPERSAWLLLALGACALGYLGGQAEALGEDSAPLQGLRAERSPDTEAQLAQDPASPPGPSAASSGQLAQPRRALASGSAPGAARASEAPRPSDLEHVGTPRAEEGGAERAGNYPARLALGILPDPRVEAWIAATKELLGPPPSDQSPMRLPEAWRELVLALDEERRGRLVRGLLEHFPGLSWSELDRVLGVTPQDMLPSLAAAWRATRTPWARARLLEALQFGDEPPPGVIEQLAREHPRDLPTLRVIATHDRVLARRLFAQLPGRQARVLAAGLAEDDDTAAAEYLRLCEEQLSAALLLRALERSPRAFEAAVRAHEGDPRWASASTLARISHLLDQGGDTSKVREAFVRSWRQLASDDLLFTLGEMDDYEVRFPEQELAVRQIVLSGTREQALEALRFATGPGRWELYASLGSEAALSSAVEQMVELVEERPLAVADQLAGFFRHFRRLEGRDALDLAASLAKLGDRAAARRALMLAPSGKERDFQLQLLERNELGQVGWGEGEE